MSRFLYVFTPQDRDKLLLQNYVLLKSDEAKNVYVFENSEELCFNCDEIDAVQTDILTF